MSARTIAVAGIDVQAEGIEVRLSVSLLHPASSTPSSEALPAGDATADTEHSPAQVAVRSVAAAHPTLLAAFELVHSVVLTSQVEALQAQLRQQQGTQSSEGGAA